MDMLNKFDVIVIGGGIYGAIASYFLKKNNLNVLLIEKERIGKGGATSFSRGIVRVYDPDIDLMKIAYEGALEYIHWDKNKYPGKSPYHQTGFLYLMHKENLEMANEFVKEVSSDEYPIDVLKPIQLKEMFPYLTDCNDKIGIYEHKGGYGDPIQTAYLFYTGYSELGGKVFENCTIEKEMLKFHDGNWELKMNNTIFQSSVILNTTGAFIGDFEYEISIFTRSISLSNFQSHTDLTIKHPIIDEEVETFIRPVDNDSFFCGSQVFEIVDSPHLLKSKDILEADDSTQRIKLLIEEDVKLNYFFKGFDAYTKQNRPYVGFYQNGLYIASGFSGRGYKCAISVCKNIVEDIRKYLKDGTEQCSVNWNMHEKV